MGSIKGFFRQANGTFAPVMIEAMPLTGTGLFSLTTSVSPNKDTINVSTSDALTTDVWVGGVSNVTSGRNLYLTTDADVYVAFDEDADNTKVVWKSTDPPLNLSGMSFQRIAVMRVAGDANVRGVVWGN